MRLSYRPATRIVALCLGLAVMRAYAVAAPTPLPDDAGAAQSQTRGPIAAVLYTRGGKKITVNGEIAGSGATLLTGSRIQTPDDVGATIVLSDLATIEIGPNADIVLDFSEGRLSLRILRGCVKKQVDEKLEYSETVAEGEPVQQRKESRTVCVGAAAIADSAKQSGSIGAGTVPPAGGGLWGLGTYQTIALLGGILAAITAAIAGTRNDADETPPVVSPML